MRVTAQSPKLNIPTAIVVQAQPNVFSFLNPWLLANFAQLRTSPSVGLSELLKFQIDRRFQFIDHICIWLFAHRRALSEHTSQESYRHGQEQNESNHYPTLPSSFNPKSF